MISSSIATQFEIGAAGQGCSSMQAKQQAIVIEVLDALEADRLELPVLPEMAFKIRSLLADPDSSTGAFVKLLSGDLSITLYLIKAANSAALSNGSPVGNLHDAIPRLGYRMLYSMVMNITLSKLFQARSPLIDRKLKELLEHSRQVAATSYALAQNKPHLKAEDAMLAGLVHEIGALPLYLYADRHYPDIDPLTQDSLIDLFSAAIGLRVLESWNFPDALIHVAAEQLDLWAHSRSDVADYVDVVTLARLQTQAHAQTFSWRNISAAERLGYYAGDCKNFLNSHAQQLAVANSLLGIGMAQAA